VAEVKLLLVSENRGTLYWNSISSFNFDLSIVSGMSFCFCLPNFVVIGRSVVELTSYPFFQDGGQQPYCI